MKYLALTVLLAVVQTSTPVPRKAANPSNAASQKAAERSGNDRTPAKTAPSIVQPIGTEPDRSNCDDSVSGNAQKAVTVRELPPVSVTKDRLDKLYIFFTGLLMLIGGVGVRAAYKTLRAIERQGLSMRRQTTHLRKSVVVARRNARAAKASADALINAERAWITVAVGGMFVGELNCRYAKVPVKNTGRTPARITRMVVTSRLVPFPKDGWGRPGELPAEFTLGDSSHTMEVEGRDFVIPPGGEHLMYGVIFNTEWATLTKKVGDGKQSWYVYGFVEYFDTIEGRKPHKTGFCEIYWVSEEGSTGVEGFRFSPTIIPAAYICAT